MYVIYIPGVNVAYEHDDVYDDRCVYGHDDSECDRPAESYHKS